VALDCDLLDLDPGNSCEPRPFVQECYELGHRPPVALGVNLHGAALAVAHPPHHHELAGPADGRVAEPDALHVAAHDGMDRFGARYAPPLSHGADRFGARHAPPLSHGSSDAQRS
jgi:hypothetical protein